MDCRLVESGAKKYLECLAAGEPIVSEADVLDLVVACGENDTDLLMLHSQALSEDFFSLRTGVAGMVLQKLANYRVRTALVAPNELAGQGRFRELVLETNRGRDFRVFDTREAAEKWLLE